MAPVKLLPYDISYFKQLRSEDLYFVDKTKYLPLMEVTDHFLFLIRPRRFGKLSGGCVKMKICTADIYNLQSLWRPERPTST
ncbi:MAG: AAA family ATPase [Prevotella sp.]|nr:AAA family ATPase [Prevotella sp.]MBR7065633.1 AAA family ATPase [Prevotella sp.]